MSSVSADAAAARPATTPRWRPALTCLSVVLLLGTFLAAGNASAQPVSAPSMGQAQPLYDCSLPPNPTPENWACTDGGMPPAPILPPEVQRSIPDSVARAAGSTFCNADGTTCWNVDDDFSARLYTSSVRFMKNTQQVGSATLDFQWSLQGNGTFLDLFRIVPSMRVNSSFFLVSLYNGAEGVNGGGTELDQRFYSNQTPSAAGVARNCPCNSRAVLRDDQNIDHNSRAEFSLSIPNQNGFWYFYVRSPVTHRDGPSAGQSTIYRFRPADHLSGDSIGGGWSV